MATPYSISHNVVLPQLLEWFNTLPEASRVIQPLDFPLFNVKVVADPLTSTTSIVIGDQTESVSSSNYVGEITYSWVGTKHSTVAQTATLDSFNEVSRVVDLRTNVQAANHVYKFTFEAGRSQYDVVEISGDSSTVTSGMTLWVEGTIDYEFTIDDITKFTLNNPGSYTDGDQMAIIVNAQFSDIAADINALVNQAVNAASSAETSKDTAIAASVNAQTSAQDAQDARDASEAFAVNSLSHATDANASKLAAQQAAADANTSAINAQGIVDAAIDELAEPTGAQRIGGTRRDGSTALLQALLDELATFKLGGLTSAVERDIHEKMSDFASITDFGAVGDAVTYNDAAFAQAIASGKKVLYVPEGVYRLAGSLDIYTGLRFIGPGSPELGYGTVDDKQWLRPGYKHLMPGASFLFDGTGDVKQVTMPQRDDEYSTVTYCVRVINVGIGSSSAAITGIAIIQDMNCFTAGGTVTKPADDGRASVYEVGLVIDDAARTKIIDCARFGYFSKAGTVISSRLGNDDPDYNTFIGGSTMGRHGIAILGSNTGPASFGLSSTRCNYMGIYALDHHSRGNMTDPERVAYYATADTWHNIYIDGDVDASSAEINGHYFHECEIRSRSNHQIKLDHASNVSFTQCVFEFSPYNITNSDVPEFLATENVKRGVFFRDCRNNYQSTIISDKFVGRMQVPISISGDPLAGRTGLIHRNPDGGYVATMIGSDSNIGDASVQLTRDINDGSSGWKMFMDVSASDTLNFKHGTQSSAAMQYTTGNIRVPSAGERRLLHEVGTALTPASGVISVTRSYHAVTGTGDVVTINGGTAGMRLILRPTSTGDVMTLKRTGNIRTPGSVDLVITGSLSHVELIYTGTFWCVLQYSNNG